MSDTTTTVWQFLAAFIDEYGYPPTLRELAAGCNLSISSVQRHLWHLEGRGVLELHSGARAIKLVERPPHQETDF